MKITKRPTQSADTTTGIWQSIIDKLIEFGKEDLANQIIGAYKDGVSKEIITQKFMQIIGTGEEIIWQMVLMVDEDYIFDQTELGLPNGLKMEFYDGKAEWPGATMSGTHPVAGQRLVFLMLRSKAVKIRWALELAIILYDLPWVINALQSFHKIDTEIVEEVEVAVSRVIVPFKAINYQALDERWTTGENGDPIEQLVPDISWFSVYAGGSEWVEAVV